MNRYKSPNFDDRSSSEIKYLIMHYTGMKTGIDALERLCDPEAKVSAHYLIEENGKIHALVDEDKRAWHAGISKWGNDVGLNNLSIGIEIVNTGHSYPGYESEYQAFPEKQMQSLIGLSKEIIKRHNILPYNVLGHSDIAWRRKIDPGEKFDWERLASEGIGVWPKGVGVSDIPALDVFLEQLKQYGYDTEGCLENPEEIISAFQRHFRQENFDGILDEETASIINALLQIKN